MTHTYIAIAVNFKEHKVTFLLENQTEYTIDIPEDRDVAILVTEGTLEE